MAVVRTNRLRQAHPVVPGSPICGMRMPSAAGARGHLMAASDRRLDSPAGPKGRRYCHRHANKQLKAPEKLETHPPVSDFARHPYMLMNLGQRDEPLAKGS